MCGVIVVDAKSFRSTNLGRDAYIHDHCLGYRHNYLLFCQFPNSNLFTHRMLFSREKPLVKTMAPGLFPIVLKPKIPCCNFPLFIWIYVLVRSIYQISYNLIYLNTVEGLTTPSHVGLQVFVVCVQVMLVLLGSPTGLITLVSYDRKIDPRAVDFTKAFSQENIIWWVNKLLLGNW